MCSLSTKVHVHQLSTCGARVRSQKRVCTYHASPRVEPLTAQGPDVNTLLPRCRVGGPPQGLLDLGVEGLGCSALCVRRLRREGAGAIRIARGYSSSGVRGDGRDHQTHARDSLHVQVLLSCATLQGDRSSLAAALDEQCEPRAARAPAAASSGLRMVALSRARSGPSTASGPAA